METSMNIQFNLFDVNGKNVIPVIRKAAHQGANNWTINMTGQRISPGIYFMVLQSETGGLLKRKVVLM